MANLSNINNILRTNSTGVGIFADAGSYPLEITSVTTAGVKLINTAGATYDIYANASEEFIIAKNGVGDRLVINSGGDATFTGNIRTGTSLLTANTNFDNLVIEGTTHSGITIFSGTSSNGAIYFGDGSGSNSNGQVKYHHSSDSMLFVTGDTNALTITTGGATFTGTINSGAITSTGTIGTAKIIMQTDGTLDWGNAKDYGTLTWDTGYAIIAGNVSKGLKFRTNDSTDALTLDTSQNATFAGNVGVNTASTSATLTVTGNVSDDWAGRFENVHAGGYGILAKIASADAGDYIFQARTGSTNVMTIIGTGNVGIGTTGPGAKLEVAGNTIIGVGTLGTQADALLTLNAANSFGGLDIISQRASGNIGGLRFTNSSSTLMGLYLVTTTGDHTWYAGGVSLKMTLLANGNVGIGVTSPDYTLQVGDGDLKSFNIGGALGYSAWTNSYSVSITNIQTLLDQNGDALETGGNYRFTGHIDGTGTDQGATAVFWNGNGTWYVNNTMESANASNHIHFLISGGVPSVATWHGSNYNVRVYHERMNLNEGNGTDNTNSLFGTDGYIQYDEGQTRLSYGGLVIGATSGTGATNLQIGGNSSLARIIPIVDNVGYIGESTHRWQAVYAVNGTIQTSDEREKTEIKETTLGLDFINDLKPISYKWIDGEQQDKGKDEREHQGLIAQQVGETLEKHGIDKNKFGGLDIQKTDKYDDFHGMSYEQMIAPMIKAIQELKAEIEILKTQINN